MRSTLAVVLALACAEALRLRLPARRRSRRSCAGSGTRRPRGLCEERTPYVQGRKLDALCKPILDCLNDTRCIKTYCGATTIRQGWVLESATREK